MFQANSLINLTLTLDNLDPISSAKSSGSYLT